MDLIQRITDLIEPTVQDLGYDLVRVQISGDKRMQLQIMAERSNGTGMGIDDCATLSRSISALLDVEDPIQGAFTLEVSSPGIDRPLVRLEDFERFEGFEARIETSMPLDGRRRFKGLLGGVRDETVMIATEDGEVVIPFNDIARAKLILTDALINAAADKGLS